MKIFNEQQLLDEGFRKQVIQEIEGPENLARKQESFKRYEIYRDRIKKYILLQLQNELDPETVQEMQNRISVINIYKKIVKKKARVYQTRPVRTAETDEQTQDLADFIDALKLNMGMKKANRFMEAMQNIGIEIMPYEMPNEYNPNGEPVYKLKVNVLAGHFYDVIEDQKNPEVVRAYIKSNYHNGSMASDVAPYERTSQSTSQNFRDGDGRNQAIADSPSDNDNNNSKSYVWWSDSYHFTTNSKGQILDQTMNKMASVNEEDIINPIGKMPAVFDGKDQDYAFWSVGGEDIIEGSILINTILTDMYFATKYQSTGLFYMFGKGIPKTIKVGANQAVTVEVEDGDPTPQIGFANPSPQLEVMMREVEQALAMLLSTNDLEPDAIKGSLSVANAASGVQEMIQRSEPTNAIEDEHERYRDIEPEVVRIAGLWAELYKSTNQLNPIYDFNTNMAEIDYSIKYPKPTPYMTDGEKLDTIDKKLRMNLTSRVSAYMDANEGSDEEQAREELAKIALEKLESINRTLLGNDNEQGDKETDLQESKEDQEEREG